jgi:hypothetical protein
VHGIVEQRDAVAEEAAEDFGDDEAKCGGHGPRENGWLQRRVRVAMSDVATMRMSVGMRMIVRVGVARAVVGVSAHERLSYDRCESAAIGGDV